MKSKEEIRDLLDETNHLTQVEQACAIWNAALDMAAENAKITYRLKDVYCGVDKSSITSLKFKTYEK